MIKRMILAILEVLLFCSVAGLVMYMSYLTRLVIKDVTEKVRRYRDGHETATSNFKKD